MKKLGILFFCVTIILFLVSCSSWLVDLNTPKSEELKAKYDFYESSVADIRTYMRVTPEQADEIFLVLVNCGLDDDIRSINKTSELENTYSYDWYGSYKTYDVVVIDGVAKTVKDDYEVFYSAAIPENAAQKYNANEYFYGTTEPSTTTSPTTSEPITTAAPTTSKPTEAPTTQPPTTTEVPTTIPPTTEKQKIFIVFWGNTGNKVHITPTCPTIKNGILSGTLDECKAAGHTEGWCGRCSDIWTDEKYLKEGNPYAEMYYENEEYYKLPLSER